MIAPPAPPAPYPARGSGRFAWPHQALPMTADCALLARAGVAEVTITGALDLRDPAALDALRFVRDCVAVGITAGWTVADAGAVDPNELTHLCPPDAFPGHEQLLAAWHDFAFGVLYWRQGPGFAIVRDVRPAWESAYYTLECDGTLECFERLRTPTPIATLPEREREAYPSLREARLVLEIEGVALTLPYRIHKWPIPFLSV